MNICDYVIIYYYPTAPYNPPRTRGLTYNPIKNDEILPFNNVYTKKIMYFCILIKTIKNKRTYNYD